MAGPVRKLRQLLQEVSEHPHLSEDLRSDAQYYLDQIKNNISREKYCVVVTRLGHVDLYPRANPPDNDEVDAWLTCYCGSININVTPCTTHISCETARRIALECQFVTPSLTDENGVLETPNEAKTRFLVGLANDVVNQEKYVDIINWCGDDLPRGLIVNRSPRVEHTRLVRTTRGRMVRQFNLNGLRDVFASDKKSANKSRGIKIKVEDYEETKNQDVATSSRFRPCSLGKDEKTELEENEEKTKRAKRKWLLKLRILDDDILPEVKSGQDNN